MQKVKPYINPKQPRKDGSFTVYVACIIRRKVVRFNTGVTCRASEWSSEGVVAGNTREAKDKNLIIADCMARITDIFVRYRLMHTEVTADQLRREYDMYSVNTDFYAYAAHVLRAYKEQISEGTYRRHASQLQKVKEFAPTLLIRDIDEDWIARYMLWCKRSRGNKQSSVKSSTNVIKFYLNRAVKDKLIEKNPFEELAISSGESDREFLVEGELLRLLDLYKSPKLPTAHQNVLRYFLFACFSGLRFSDVQRLHYEHIVGNFIVMELQKTQHSSGMVVKLPITPQMSHLMGELVAGRKVFETYSDYRTNLMLKELLPMAKISKKITFHCSRHTFATIFLRKTKNIVALQRLLGHKKIEQTLLYSHLLANDVANEMSVSFSEFKNGSR